MGLCTEEGRDERRDNVDGENYAVSGSPKPRTTTPHVLSMGFWALGSSGCG